MKKKTNLKKAGKNGSAGELFKKEQLDNALRYAEDVFERACMDFFLLDETAIQIKDRNTLDQLPELSLGVTVANWGEIQQRLFRTAMEFLDKDWKETEYGFAFEKDGVPIKVKVIKKHRRFFGNLNTIFYDYTNFFIPNQFDKYRKMRYMVR
ncbi:MAG: hypothetical protein GY861_05290 [bacterium]|nr:hypothetical protein [bacterium]